jgi:hypothetical protein
VGSWCRTTLTHDHATANQDRAVCLVSLSQRLLAKRPRPRNPAFIFSAGCTMGLSSFDLGAGHARTQQLTGRRKKRPGEDQAPARFHHKTRRA